MMCERDVEDEQKTLEFVPDYYKIQMMCETAVEKHIRAIEFVPDQSRPKECVMRLLKHTHAP